MEIEVIDVFTNETTEGKTSVSKVFQFNNYKSISRIWVDAILTSPSGILSTGWAIDKIGWNGKLSASYRNLDTRIEVFSTTSKVGSVDIGENNLLSVSWVAPLGAGVISPHANITVKLRVLGEKYISFIPTDLENFGFNNLGNSFNDITKRLTLPAIIILLILSAIAFLLILTLPRIDTSLKIADNSTKILKKRV